MRYRDKEEDDGIYISAREIYPFEEHIRPGYGYDMIYSRNGGNGRRTDGTEETDEGQTVRSKSYRDNNIYIYISSRSKIE